jgi:hypothetical protein
MGRWDLCIKCCSRDFKLTGNLGALDVEGRSTIKVNMHHTWWPRHFYKILLNINMNVKEIVCEAVDWVKLALDKVRCYYIGWEICDNLSFHVSLWMKTVPLCVWLDYHWISMHETSIYEGADLGVRFANFLFRRLPWLLSAKLRAWENTGMVSCMWWTVSADVRNAIHQKHVFHVEPVIKSWTQRDQLYIWKVKGSFCLVHSYRACHSFLFRRNSVRLI